MRAGGAGRRWNAVDQAALQRHDLGQLQVGNAALVKTLDTPDGLTFSVDLTFLSSRPELARVLANSFWMTYQPGPRRATAERTASTLKLLHGFLNYRSQSQSDVQSARDLSTDLLKEFAVWLLTKRRLKRKSAAGLFAACCCFLRRARRL